MMDEISKGFFWIPVFRHIFPIFDILYGCPFVFRFTFLKVARKFTPPENLPGKGPAEEVVHIEKKKLCTFVNFFTKFKTKNSCKTAKYVLSK
jgi:hypothetical protein